MRKFIWALLIIFLLSAVCLYNGFYMKNLCLEIEQKTAAALSYGEEENWDEALSYLEDIKKLKSDKEIYLIFVSAKDKIEKLETYLEDGETFAKAGNFSEFYRNTKGIFSITESLKEEQIFTLKTLF